MFARTATVLTGTALESYLGMVATRSETLLATLRAMAAGGPAREAEAEAAHALAGSAGMFGFERLAVLARRFERAVRAGSPELPALAQALDAAIEASLPTMRNHDLVSATA